MKFDWKIQVAAAAILLALSTGAVTAYNHHQREIGRREMVIAQLAAEHRAALQRADSLEKAFRIDTVRFVRLRTVWDTAYRTLTDTVQLTDTVRVPVTVLVTADSTIRACSQALGTCEQRVAAERTARQAADRQVKILLQQMPGPLSRCGAGVGAAAVWDGKGVRAGPGVTVGCRVFP